MPTKSELKLVAQRTNSTVRSAPRVEERDISILEVSEIASWQDRVANGYNPSYLHIAYFYRMTETVQVCGDLASTVRGRAIEVQNMVLEIYCEHGLEGVL